MHGTWQTTGRQGAVVVAGFAGIAVIASGIAAAVGQFVASLAEAVLFTVFSLAVLLAVAGTWAVGYRMRHREAPWARLARRITPEPVMHAPPGPERPAVGQAMPRELHQHTHYHWHGAEPPAEILRQPAVRDERR
jgi:hypothetical protein